jgi:hypothetical protein
MRERGAFGRPLIVAADLAVLEYAKVPLVAETIELAKALYLARVYPCHEVILEAEGGEVRREFGGSAVALGPY